MSEKFLYAVNLVASKFWKSSISPDKIKEIVVVKMDEIGDMTAAVHVFELLKQYAPEAKLTVLCKPFVGSLIAADPHIDKIIFETEDMPSKADVWVELRGTWETFFRSILRTKKVRLDRGTVRFKQRGNQAHERITNFRIIEPLVGTVNWQCKPLFINDQDQANANNILKSLFKIQSIDSKPFVVIHPGGRSLLRRWPAIRFAQIINDIYRQYGWKSLVIGTTDEAAILHEIEKETSDNSAIWLTQESLGTFAAVISKAVLFIGNESGPLQIADIMGVKSLGLFGPGVANVFYPQTTGSRVIHNILDCNPCDQIHCVRSESKCIDMISVQEVMLVLPQMGLT